MRKHTHTLDISEFLQVDLRLKCAPLLGASFKVVEHPLVCIRVLWLGDLGMVKLPDELYERLIKNGKGTPSNGVTREAMGKGFGVKSC